MLFCLRVSQVTVGSVRLGSPVGSPGTNRHRYSFRCSFICFFGQKESRASLNSPSELSSDVGE